METLVVAQHRNQYYSGVKPQRPAKFGLPLLLQPKAPPMLLLLLTLQKHHHQLPSPIPFDIGRFKTASKSSPITINVKTPRKEISFNEEMGFVNENLLFSELWAGPAYSNSPPPSSLPIPKFSMRPPKRTVSLDSPVSDYADFDVQPTVKSAPASPSREHSPCIRDMFLSADSATKTLRRILNLDVAEE
ncbi:hypothetical protein OIU74_019755 [Salix koriyanagi]|uniref:Uncharacterized protein n=1 Tax=Salix koriyanagi TaxID=2511006 RepID=A0A9Q0SKR0_9ROSI|nr:hypothetical protein OIU74_019755 [Salix koriyanagi]